MRDLLHSALGALLMTVAACGGGDPSGGGNGNDGTDGGGMTDGTTGNGGTDGHVPDPNTPLVEAIPGLWETIEVNGSSVSSDGCDCASTECTNIPPEAQPGDQPRGTLRCATTNDDGFCAPFGCMAVDPSNPTCRYFGHDLGTPGDACVWQFNFDGWPLILDGSTLRSDPPPNCPSPDFRHFCDRFYGQVLDNGTRIEYTREEWMRPDRSDLVTLTYVYRKVR